MLQLSGLPDLEVARACLQPATVARSEGLGTKAAVEHLLDGGRVCERCGYEVS
jgi:hypothetical protein